MYNTSTLFAVCDSICPVRIIYIFDTNDSVLYGCIISKKLIYLHFGFVSKLCNMIKYI